MISIPPADAIGVWRGSVSGRELSDPSGGTNYSGAELTINEDGTFVLHDSSGAKATGQVRADGNHLVLDGAFVSPAARAGERISDRLSFSGSDALYGSVDTMFRGMRVRGSANLQKVS